MAELNECINLVAKDLTIAALDKVNPNKFEKLNIDEIISTYVGVYSSFLEALATVKPEELKSYARESRKFLSQD
ncbi:hypothetical protein [Paenibacillus donghaensis]|uniref:Uncharacterized protein n=1 Tax=Paenibacillus donghaensis TaxID=414771 RepID=A0A2Z2KBG9_9BACL|nr:hypothetical protein [Paenibacillus donghaensis]ASA20243.1 hypothetical protein B9T62_05165 [Paenibacillus donghaensis]